MILPVSDCVSMIPRFLWPKNYRRSLTYLAAGILIAAVTLYLALPIVALFFRVTPEMFFTALHDPDVISALWLSLITTSITLAVVILVGTPFAYFHSRYSYPGKVIVDTLIDLPLVLPPAVAGVALLVSIRQGRDSRAGTSLCSGSRLPLPRLR